MVFFSVIIPVYNRDLLSVRALSSVLRQDFKHFECLLVDDGSSTSFQPIFEKTVQGDNRFRFVRLGKNKGVSVARNFGVSLTTAPWIAFLDSDDEWMPEKLRFHHDLISQTGAHLSETEEFWIRNGKRVNRCDYHLKSPGNVFLKSLKRCILTPSSVVVSRQAFLDVGGFDEKLPVCEDYDLWLRLSACHPLYLIEKPLTIRYQGHDGQLSLAGHIKDIFRIRALKNLLKFLKKKDSFEDCPIIFPRFAKKEIVVSELINRCNIVVAGAKKRGIWFRFLYYKSLSFLMQFFCIDFFKKWK